MIRTVNAQEAQANLPELLSLVWAGGEVLITEAEQPIVKLTPVAPMKKKRVAGLHRGAIWTSEDFDEPLPDEFWLGQE